MSAIEIEVDHKNQNWLFHPAKFVVRGSLDVDRCNEIEDRRVAQKWPEPIPGHRIGYDPETGEGYIRDQLFAPEHKATLDKIKASGRGFGQDNTRYPKAHGPSWLYFMSRAIESGYGKVVKGKIPEDFGGEPDLDYITRRQKSPMDRLAAAIESQTESNRALADAIIKAIPATRGKG